MNPEVVPTWLAGVDRLSGIESPSLDDYIRGVSEYITESAKLDPGPKKAAQIRLSNALALALKTDLKAKLPHLEAHAGEKDVSGALRIVKADVSETDTLDGLRLAVELKPINLAVGRAIWNRFGDIRTFAVNLHLKFPFAVVGGVLAIPTYELKGTERKSTLHLIERAVERLSRAGGRETEGDAPHLLEGIGVVVYDPDKGGLDPDVPAADSRLRWPEFVEDLATAYEARFEI